MVSCGLERGWFVRGLGEVARAMVDILLWEVFRVAFGVNYLGMVHKLVESWEGGEEREFSQDCPGLKEGHTCFKPPPGSNN